MPALGQRILACVMKVRCPKCRKEQEILDILHNRRVVCKHCGHEFKGVGLETTELAEQVYSKFMAQRAAREQAEEEDKKDTN
jgi:transcription elongation factor Elf1